MIKFRRLAPGHYQSKNGRVVIRRILQDLSNHPIGWEVHVDNLSIHYRFDLADTLHCAKCWAERHMKELDQYYADYSL